MDYHFKLLFTLLLVLLFFRGEAQKVHFYTLSVFNAATQLPGAVWTTPVHPGVAAGAEWAYNRNEKNRFFQTGKVGFYHHRFVQNNAILLSEFGYRQAIWRGLGAEMRLGGGYIHSFPGTEVFRLKDGKYQKKAAWGRPQGAADAALALSWQWGQGIHRRRVFAEYQFLMQFPFVKQYVTLLPVTALHIGAAVPFDYCSKKQRHEK